MKIAVTYENGQVFQHFGHCAEFKLYQEENGKSCQKRLSAPREADMERWRDS